MNKTDKGHVSSIRNELPTREWPKPLDLRALAQRPPAPPAHIVDGWLPEGEVTLFAGHGGIGKSAIALHLGACIALERRWFGLQVRSRLVLYISAEDGADVIHWRLRRICTHLGVAITDLADRFRIIDASRSDAELMAAQPSELRPTERYHAP
jgi:RecA-family ATPase